MRLIIEYSHLAGKKIFPVIKPIMIYNKIVRNNTNKAKQNNRKKQRGKII